MNIDHAGQPAVSLNGFKGNVHSQFGEDGILAEALSRLGIRTGYFVEFGAWDGKYLSNTYLLYQQGWSGCYIEGDFHRFQDLCRNVPEPRVTKMNRWVGWRADDSLDAILAEAKVPHEFDVLSIDIDSDDFRVWEAAVRFRPKLVVVEFNQTIPNNCHYVQPEKSTKGNSARALHHLGQTKGYTLFAATETNLLFVVDELFPALGIGRGLLEEVRPDKGFIFFGYDGEIIMTGGMHGNPWQYQAPIVQTMPPFFRYFGERHWLLDWLKRAYVRALRGPGSTAQA